MGEAKEKEKRRREHASKIVAAFEEFIEAIIHDKITYNDCQSALIRMEVKDALIDILVTPPPK